MEILYINTSFHLQIKHLNCFCRLSVSAPEWIVLGVSCTVFWATIAVFEIRYTREYYEPLWLPAIGNTEGYPVTSTGEARLHQTRNFSSEKVAREYRCWALLPGSLRAALCSGQIWWRHLLFHVSTVVSLGLAVTFLLIVLKLWGFS